MMTTTTTTTLTRPSFNLLHQPWIPVVTGSGEPQEQSVLSLLKGASDYREIVHEDPLVVVALYRFLLAFLHRALDGPKEVEEASEWLEEGLPVASIEAYARKWEDRFDLFHETHPFGQHPALDNEKFIDHWSRLQAARGSFNTNFLYSYDLRGKTPNDDHTNPPEAVRQLLAHQHFALGGLTKRFVTSAKASLYATACLTLVHGDNLLETLCLNLVPYDKRHNREHDHAAWELEPPAVAALQKGTVKPVEGLAQGYTWNARSILFRPDEHGDITTMYYAEGLAPDTSKYADPMIALTRNNKGELYPLGYREGRGLWRDLNSFVPTEDENTAPEVISSAYELLTYSGRYTQALSFSSFGLVNNKAKIALVRHELLRLPPLALKSSALKSTLQEWPELAKEEAYRLSLALKTVASGLLSKKRDGAAPREVKAQVESFQFEAAYWPQAETLFWEHIDRLPTDIEEFYEQQDTLNQAWAGSLEKLKVKTYKEITNTLEPTPETLRAVQLGYRTLWKGMANT